jgi:hypothetical protein
LRGRAHVEVRPVDRPQALAAELPGAVLALPVQPPIVGAALLAFDRLGVAADAATLRAGLPASLSERSAAWAASHSST